MYNFQVMDTSDISIGLYQAVRIVFNQKLTGNIKSVHRYRTQKKKVSKKREENKGKKGIFMKNIVRKERKRNG